MRLRVRSVGCLLVRVCVCFCVYVCVIECMLVCLWLHGTPFAWRSLILLLVLFTVCVYLVVRSFSVCLLLSLCVAKWSVGWLVG